MKKKTTPLGIVAGNGSLPRALIEACQKAGRPVFVFALSGQADSSILKGVDGQFIRLGAVGHAMRLCRKVGVRDVVFIGGVRRPSLSEIRPDWKALRMMFRVGFRLLGDDNLLKIILSEVEKQGIHVLGIDSVMPELLATEGIYGRIKPDKSDRADIRQGFKVAKLLGQADVGQAVIVQHGLVLAVEGIEGTAALIKRTADLKRKGGGGVLVKTAKPQQDRRVDLPTVGPDTVKAVAKAGLKGIAIESGSALIVRREEMIRLADRLKIFIMGVSDQC